MFAKKLSTRKIIEIPEIIILEEFESALDKWNKKTTTSPRGRHLGHYKLINRLNVFALEDNNINISDNIINVYYNISMTAAQIGLSLERWKNITTCMIEKSPGVSRLEKELYIFLKLITI
jgi:hypothetical protein